VLNPEVLLLGGEQGHWALPKPALPPQPPHSSPCMLCHITPVGPGSGSVTWTEEGRRDEEMDG
jgi:hypothetical protein